MWIPPFLLNIAKLSLSSKNHLMALGYSLPTIALLRTAISGPPQQTSMPSPWLPHFPENLER